MRSLRRSRPNRSGWMSLAFLLVGLVVVIAACGGDKAAATSVPAASKPVDTPVPTTPLKPADTPVPTPAAQEGLVPGRVVKVTDLNSYLSTIDLQWQGTLTNGQEIEASMNMMIEYVREPKAQHISIYGTSLAAQGYTADQPLEMVIIGDKTYMKAMGTWMQAPSSEGSEDLGDTFLLISDDVLKNAKNARYEGRETVNGVETKHYSFDETRLNATQLAGSKVDQAKGDIWIAVDGDYIVKMDTTLIGTEMGVLGNQTMSNGSMHMVMDVTDANKPITIEVPVEALESGQLPQDIPSPTTPPS